MRHLLPALLLAPLPAAAHPGHLGELAGHSHWVAGAAVAAAAVAAVLGWLKSRKEDKVKDEEPEAEPQES